MKPKEKKSVNIDSATHRLIAQASLDTGKDMYELVAEAWRSWEKGGVSGRVDEDGKDPTDDRSEAERLWLWIRSPLRDELDRSIRLAAAALAKLDHVRDLVLSLPREYTIVTMP